MPVCATDNARNETAFLPFLPTPLRNLRDASVRPTTVVAELPEVTTRPQQSAAFCIVWLNQIRGPVHEIR
jgi:hypothetical protein